MHNHWGEGVIACAPSSAEERQAGLSLSGALSSKGKVANGRLQVLTEFFQVLGLRVL